MTEPHDRRRRPTQTRSQDRVSVILEAAQTLILDVGAERFAMRELARRASMSLPSIYQYFPSKLGILRALMERQRERMLGLLLEATHQVRSRDGSAGDPVSAIDIIVDAFIEQYGTDRAAIEVWAGAQGDADLRALDREDTVAVARWLVPAITADDFYPADKAFDLALLMVTLASAAARLAFGEDAERRAGLIAGLKTMLAAPFLAEAKGVGDRTTARKDAP